MNAEWGKDNAGGRYCAGPHPQSEGTRHEHFILGSFLFTMMQTAALGSMERAELADCENVDQAYAVQDFFSKECWAHHPKPYAEFMDWRKKEDERWENDRKRLVPGM